MAAAAGPAICLTSRKILTLAFIEKGDEILLGFKKRGFGQGLWNGFGGKVENGEKVPEAAAREIKEECGLNVVASDLEQVGLSHFLFVGEPTIHEVHLFHTATFSGEVVESEEMAPRWWPKDSLPFQQMWPDDHIWYPFLLKKTPFRSLFVTEGYPKDTKVLAYQINSMDDDQLLLEEKNEAFSFPELWPRIKSLPVMSIPRQANTQEAQV